jgi:hypothetical protein
VKIQLRMIGFSAGLILLSALPAIAANGPPSDVARTTSFNQLDGVGMTTKLTFVMYVTLAIIVFGLVVLGGVTVLFWRTIGKRTDEFVRVFAISLVIVASLVLIVAGYADSQIAPAFGLFGSIVGYLFGRGETTKAAADSVAQQPGTGTQGGAQ